eukprot:SM000050S16977  [mRNA]  locus=s50:223944:226124:+ [translate_table: standard]
MARPYTGRPHPRRRPKEREASPTTRPEFDSFRPPPLKKGIRPVEAPGPFPDGEGPHYAHSREDVLGAELTANEVEELVQDCMYGNRQINLGRDGLVHNMLELIHTHWKRRRCAKVKCKGVPTVDMATVRRELEDSQVTNLSAQDKTGGKIIHQAGGALFLFRGRNYNYRLRPTFPVMLWKPPMPIYPPLVEESPGGLTKHELAALRREGKKLPPLCRLAKNGVYIALVDDVRAAFDIQELVQVDCTGLEKGDYKKIGAKLKAMVPCVLLSFERERILAWRGREWPPSPSGRPYVQASHLFDPVTPVAGTSGDLAPGDAQDSDAGTSRHGGIGLQPGQELEALWSQAEVAGLLRPVSAEGDAGLTVDETSAHSGSHSHGECTAVESRHRSGGSSQQDAD